METNSGIDDVSMFGRDRVQAHRDHQYSIYHSQSRGTDMFVTVISAPRSAETRYIQTASGVVTAPAPKALNKWIESTKNAIRVMGSTYSVHTLDIGYGLMIDMFVMQLSTKGPLEQVAQSIVTTRIQQQAKAAGQKVSQFLINLGLTGIAVSETAPTEHDFAFMVTPLHGDYPEALLPKTILGAAMDNQRASVVVLDLPLSQLGVVDGYAIVPMDIDLNSYPELHEDAMLGELDLEPEPSVDDLDLDESDASETDESEGEDFSDAEAGNYADASEEDEDESEGEVWEQVEGDEDADASEGDEEDEGDDDLIEALNDVLDEEQELLDEEDEDSLTLIPLSLTPRLVFIMDNNQGLAEHYDELSDLQGFNFVAPVASPSRDPKTRQITKPAGYLREPIKHLASSLSGLNQQVMALSSQQERASKLMVKAAVNTAQEALDYALYQMHGLVADDQAPEDVVFTLGGFEEEGDVEPVSVALSDLIDGGVSVVDGYLNVYVRAYFPRFYTDKAQATLDAVRKIFKRISDDSGVEVMVGFTEHTSDIIKGTSTMQALAEDTRVGSDEQLGQAFTAFGLGCVLDVADPVKVNSDGVLVPDCESLFVCDPSGSSVDLGMFGDSDTLVIVTDCSPVDDEE